MGGDMKSRLFCTTNNNLWMNFAVYSFCLLIVTLSFFERPRYCLRTSLPIKVSWKNSEMQGQIFSCESQKSLNFSTTSRELAVAEHLQAQLSVIELWIERLNLPSITEYNGSELSVELNLMSDSLTVFARKILEARFKNLIEHDVNLEVAVNLATFGLSQERPQFSHARAQSIFNVKVEELYRYPLSERLALLRAGVTDILKPTESAHKATATLQENITALAIRNDQGLVKNAGLLVSMSEFKKQVSEISEVGRTVVLSCEPLDLIDLQIVAQVSRQIWWLKNCDKQIVDLNDAESMSIHEYALKNPKAAVVQFFGPALLSELKSGKNPIDGISQIKLSRLEQKMKAIAPLSPSIAYFTKSVLN